MHWISLIIAIGWLTPLASAQQLVRADKVAFANQVLQRVGATYGFGVLELPKLVIFPRKPGNKRIAKLELALASTQRTTNSLDRSRLLMDEELFDLCAAVDKNVGQHGAALAFVLSHEMAHFYLKHATFNNFVDQKNAHITKEESYRQEKEADQTGLLFAYLAGFDPEPVLDRLFNAIYGQYKLKDPLPGHPTRQDRQQTTKLRAQEFRTYGYLFAIGHALYCRENYAEAARCFEYVYSRYPLKEAYTNFGVCRLQQAVRQKKKTPISYFALPFEVDPRNRLLRLDERSESTNAVGVTSLLNDARAAFRQGREMDEAYVPAYLNGAITELLADNPYAALGILNEEQQRIGSPLPPNGLLIQGIVRFALGEQTKAEADLKAAVATRNAYQADYNLFVFQNLNKGTNESLQQPWQRLKNQNARQNLGCQVQTLLVVEIDKAPVNVPFTTRLIEQNNPLPFIVVETGQMGSTTYFRAKMDSTKNLQRQSNVYFVQKKSR